MVANSVTASDPRIRFAVVFFPLFLYMSSLSPFVQYSDTGETQTVPYILGIARPAGSPLFTLIGFLFSHLFPIGTVAWRLSFMCVIAMLVATFMLYSLALQLRCDPYTAAASSWLFACSPTAWKYGTHAELHAVALMFTMLSIVRIVRFRQSGDPRALCEAALWFGLGLANHPIASLLLPALIVIAWPCRASITRVTGARACAIVLACFSLYAYLPLRSAYITTHRLDPTQALGLPVGQAFWDYNHPATWEGFKREVLAEDFKPGNAVTRLFSLQAYRVAFPKYASFAQEEYAFIVLVAAVAGLCVLLKEDCYLGIGLTLAGITTTTFVFNFSEGHVERYFFTSFALISVYAAVGVTRTVRILVEQKRPAIVLSGVFFLGLTTREIVSHAELFQLRNDDSAQRWIDRVRSHTPSNAVIVAGWDFATPLAYGAYVEGSMGERIIQSAILADDQPYLADWLRKRPVYLAPYAPPSLVGYRFDPVDAFWPPLYRVRSTNPIP